MKIVIDIVDDDYNRLNSYPDGNTFYPITARLYKAVKDGTPLPKGHGRLKDVDRLESHDEYDGQGFTKSVYKDDIDNLPTIIEADKTESEEV